MLNGGVASEVEEVPETIFEGGSNAKHYEDPFSLYKLLEKNNPIGEKGNKSASSLKCPPCFTPVNEKMYPM